MEHPLMYCKAFTETQLEAFSGFAQARKRDRAATSADRLLYLHDDLRVRDGIFRDDPLVFATDDPEWERFCNQTISFPSTWIPDPRALSSHRADTYANCEGDDR